MRKSNPVATVRPLLAGLFFVLAFAIPLHPEGSGEERIWGVPISTFRKRLERGDYDFLRALDYSDFPSAEVGRAGPGAAFYLSFVFDRLGMDDMRRRMLRLQWEMPEGIWSREAGRLLLRDLIDTGKLADAEMVALRYTAGYPGECGGMLLLLETLSRQEKDQLLLSLLDELQEPKQDMRPPEERARVPAAQEILFHRAGASYRLGRDGWRELFRELFVENPVSDVHQRAADFLAEEGLLEKVPQEDRAAFMGKAEVAKREYHKAVAHLDPLVRKAAPQMMHPVMIREAELAYRGSGKAAAGARAMDLLADRASGAALFAALEMSGRLHRSGGEYAAAARQLEKSLLFAPDQESFDRALWYYLSSIVRQSGIGAIPTIVTYSRQWHDAEYFSDLLGDLCRELVAREDWAALQRLYLDLDGYAPASTQAQYAVVLAGVVKSGAFRLPDREPVRYAADLYRQAFLLEGHPYYTLIAATALGERLRIEAGDERDSGKHDPIGENLPGGGSVSGEELLTAGFFRYGLRREGYEWLLRYGMHIRPAALQENARTLAAGGKILESLRIMDRSLDGRPEPYLRETLELLYPRAFEKEVRGVTERYELPVPLFYGLIREESYFDPTIESWAGAVGLTQLMPATAADMSRRMRLKDPDLTDPATNLSIGAYYFKHLLERFEQPLYALVGYNAGYGRIRTWKNVWRHLPATVFVERIPFLETRHYVRKILVSAAYYGYLYEGRAPEETVRLLFPDL